MCCLSILVRMFLLCDVAQLSEPFCQTDDRDHERDAIIYWAYLMTLASPCIVYPVREEN